MAIRTLNIHTLVESIMYYKMALVVRSLDVALKHCDMAREGYDVENGHPVSIRHENYSQFPDHSYPGPY